MKSSSPEKEPNRRVVVVAKFNVAPAHMTIVKNGAGSNWAMAIYKALKEVFKDPKIKGKRNFFPVHLTVMNGDGTDE
jgi:hypothetical protein